MPLMLLLREPVSALSHGVWMLLAPPAALLLWRRGVGDRVKQLCLLSYALSLAACAGASAAYHGVRVPAEQLSGFLIADHIGINILIAGTYTPVAWTLMRGRWRPGTLGVAWALAGAGAALQLLYGTMPIWSSTFFYLIMGWGALFCYRELRRTLTARALRPILIGGGCYTLGAALNLLQWPVLWPGVIGAHEVFHFLVIAGSIAHFVFIYRVVAPHTHTHTHTQGQGAPTPAPELPPTRASLPLSSTGRDVSRGSRARGRAG